MPTEIREKPAELFAPTPKTSPLGWRCWLLVLSVSVLVCCFKLGSARTLTEHEAWPAGGAKQMSLDHDWLFPKIGDHLWLEKPPLLHWLIVLSASVFGGFSEAAVRFPSVLAGLGIVAIVTKLAFQWFGRRTAVFTGLAQATTVHFITYARLAEAEMLLAFFIVLALFLFARIHSIGSAAPEPNRHSAFVFWVVVGLSNMTKGLGFGALIILSVCAAYLFFNRERAAWQRTISWPGIALGFVIALAWPVAVSLLRAPESALLWRGTLAQRILGGQFDQPAWYYLSTAPWQLLPWTPALLVAVGPSLTQSWRNKSSPDRFIWCWALVPIALLTLFRGKHHHYIIAPLCALSPLCAIGLLRVGTRLAITSIALAVAGILFVHGWIMPRQDPWADDRDFLKSVRSFVPGGVPLAAISGQEIARPIFYVDPAPQGVWDAADLKKYFPATQFFLIARQKEETELMKLGPVEAISQSRHTKAERTPADRFTLFRIESTSP